MKPTLVAVVTAVGGARSPSFEGEMIRIVAGLERARKKRVRLRRKPTDAKKVEMRVEAARLARLGAPKAAPRPTRGA